MKDKPDNKIKRRSKLLRDFYETERTLYREKRIKDASKENSKFRKDKILKGIYEDD